MSNTYGTIITTKGAAIIADCIVNGGQLVISEAAAGDGNGAYYQPTVNQEHLVHECWRGEIAAAELTLRHAGANAPEPQPHTMRCIFWKTSSTLCIS